MADGDTFPIPGVDYAFPPHPDIAGLAAAGFKFACRYGGPGTEGKWLHADEAAQLAEHGIWIVANAEGSADGLGNGWLVGVSWASSSDAWFRTCGMPTDRPIYLSADFDVTVEDWPAVADALRGAASVIGPGRVGVYGSYNVMRWARRDRVATWFWQTYAWSAGRWAPENHIEQYRNGVQIAGADCDLNRAQQADYGQWTIGTDMTPDESRRLSNVDSMMYYGLTLGQDVPAGELRLGFGDGTPTTAPTPVWAVDQIKELQEKIDVLQSGGGTGLTETQIRAIMRDELDKTLYAPVVKTS